MAKKIWNHTKAVPGIVILTCMLFILSCASEESRVQIFMDQKQDFIRIAGVLSMYHEVIFKSNKCKKSDSLNDEALFFMLTERDLSFCYKTLNDTVREKLIRFFEQVEISSIITDTNSIEFELPSNTNLLKEDACVYSFLYITTKSGLQTYLRNTNYVVATVPIDTNWYFIKAIVPVD